MAKCPGGLDTDIIKDTVKEGYILFNRNLIEPQ